MCAPYNIGDLIRLEGTLKDKTGVAVAPGAVTIKVREPSGTVATLSPIPNGTGVYYVNYSPTQAGKHVVQFVSTGAGQAMAEQVFTVERSYVVT